MCVCVCVLARDESRDVLNCLQVSSSWQRYMSADLTDDVSTLAYCPVCSPAGYTAAQYQRYAVPQTLNARQNLDVFHSPDLLGPLATATSTTTTAVTTTPGTTLQSSSLRLVSCSAPDLIELSSRPDQERQQDLDHGDQQQQDSDRQVRGGGVMTSFPRGHVSQSTALVFGGQASPSSERRQTINERH